MFDNDQEIIKKYSLGLISREEIIKNTENNKQTLGSIIKKYGFPTKIKTSQKAYKSATIVTLHCGDVNFMNSFLTEMRNQSEKDIDKADIGYLTDKINILKKLPQIYGTQYMKKDDKISFMPVEDIENIDKRRKELGMETWEEYKKKIS